MESVAMIIHIVAVEEKRAVLGFRNELIPFISLIGGIPDNLEHVLCKLQDYIPIYNGETL